MNVRRARGDSSTIALVLFVFLFFIAGALAVVFYMQAQDRGQQAEQASERQREATREATQARSEFEGLSTLIAGEALEREQINARLAELGLEDDDVIVHVINDMTNELERLEGRVESLGTQARAAESQLSEVQEQMTVEQAAAESRIEELRDRVEELNEDYQAYREQASNQREELNRRLQQARAEAENEIRERDSHISDIEGQLAQRDSRIRQLIQDLGRETPDVPDATRQADGRVISVSPERNVAYIDLGRQHHMVHGMRFEVFDSSRGVEVGDDGELRGKATIEIVDISDRSAAGRIVRSSRAQPILAGDQIANLVYDRDRSFKFFVFGEFDLDRDGSYSQADRETIMTLIQRWGGEVVDPEQRTRQLAAHFDDDVAEARVVPPDVDFVVIGREPRQPTELPPGDRDAVRIQEALRAEEAWERYNRIVDAAVALGIPVLNENRFLALIGHTPD